MLTLKVNKPYHFLIIHCATYEDGISMILSLQCIQSIAIKFPNAQISLLIHSSMQDFVKNNPYIKHLFCIDKTPNITICLKKAKIDISISLRPEKESTIKIFRAGIKTRIGIFSNLHSLLFNYKVKLKRNNTNKHEANYNLELLKSIGCNQITYPKIYLNISEKQEAQNYLESKFNIDSILDNGCIILYPGNGLKNVGWRAKNFFFIANEFSKTHNVLVIGLPQEVDGYKAMLVNYTNMSLDNLLILDNKNFDIRKLLSIISLARLFISNNNVLLHAAVALDVATFGFFAHKAPLSANRYYPFCNTKKHIVFTPFGIFDLKDSINEEHIVSNHGLNMDSISPEFIAEILRNKILLNYDVSAHTIIESNLLNEEENLQIDNSEELESNKQETNT